MGWTAVDETNEVDHEAKEMKVRYEKLSLL